MNRERSKAIFAKASQLFPGGVNSPVRAFKSVGGEPFIVSHGKGAYLYDVDSNAYVDYVCSWGPLVLGHANPFVVQAIKLQLERGTSYGACCELESELAKTIQSFMPGLEMLRFVNSGTEAAMTAVRLARGFTKRSKIIKFSGCYHGHLDALLVKAGSGVATLGLPDCAGVPQSSTAETLTAPYNDTASVAELFRQFPNDVAAIIIEPVVGNAGLIKPEAGYLQKLRELSAQYGALLILDEVMTGFRVHLGGAQTFYDVMPDLTMLGKVIGGGLPVGAVGGRKDIMSLLAPSGPVYQAGTLSGNPLAMSAGLATLHEWGKSGVFERACGNAMTLVQAFKECAAAAGIPLVADSAGTMFGFFFQHEAVRNYEEAKRSDVEMFKKFFNLMLEAGAYFAPSQFEAGFVSSAHDGTPIEKTVHALADVFQRLR